MKKIYLAVFALILGLSLTFSGLKAGSDPVLSTLDSIGVVLETATGTWCGYCPCGHDISNSIQQSYPKTVVICYHGPPNYGNPQDPWASIGYPMIQLFGMTSYPTGVVNRSSGILSRSAWFSYVSSYSANQPGVRIELSNPIINYSTRVVTATITMTALQNLTGAYSIFIPITENRIVYPQNVYSACGTAGINSNYMHMHVVKAIVTPNTGTQITAGPWNQNQVLTYNLNYTVPAGIELSNIDVNVIVYAQGTPYTNNAPVQNGLCVKSTSFTPVGITKTDLEANTFSLGQNYPNPFNPQTSMRFTLPKDGNVSFRVYDINGKEVSNYFNGFLKAGIYTMQFDGSQLPSGVYFYKLTAGDFSDVKRMLLVK